MRIEVEVKLHAKNERVEKAGPNFFRVYVNAKPVDGEANERIIELLSEYFGKPKSFISLVLGVTSKKKIFEVEAY